MSSLEIVVPDMTTYEQTVLRRLIALPASRDIHTSFTMRSFKVMVACHYEYLLYTAAAATAGRHRRHQRAIQPDKGGRIECIRKGQVSR
ncbi:hypothetical protein BZU93_24885 [Salmonella enterica subsp. enterica]|nr:hypothetical protein [Salmonella enterica subsp. enterica serovar Enteritidis]